MLQYSRSFIHEEGTHKIMSRGYHAVQAIFLLCSCGCPGFQAFLGRVLVNSTSQWSIPPHVKVSTRSSRADFFSSSVAQLVSSYPFPWPFRDFWSNKPLYVQYSLSIFCLPWLNFFQTFQQISKSENANPWSALATQTLVSNGNFGLELSWNLQ